jgi:hypothetical protein
MTSDLAFHALHLIIALAKWRKLFDTFAQSLSFKDFARKPLSPLDLHRRGNRGNFRWLGLRASLDM